MGKSFRVPTQDRELLCDPAWRAWPRVVAAARQTAGSSDGGTVLGPAGWPLTRFRRQCRLTLRRLARFYTRQLDLGHSSDGRQPPAWAAQPVEPAFLVTGHQPIFAHPGIWAKDALLVAAARHWADWTGRPAYALHLIVDSDFTQQAAPLIPALSSGPPDPTLAGERRPYRPAWSGPSRGIWEHLPIPSWEALDRWLAQIEAAVRRLDAPAVWAAWQRNLSLLAAAWQPGGALPLWVSRSRRLWEQRADPASAALAELPVSWLAQTRWFIWYMLDLALHGAQFQQAYNEALAAYRQLHQIPNPTEPFPPLREVDGWRELPFWVRPAPASAAVARAGEATPERRTLWVELAQDGLRLAAGDPDRPDPSQGVLRIAYPLASQGWAPWRWQVWRDWRESGWQIRPKALTLTLFVRRYVADLFVHGVGGGEYDQVTEDVAERLGGGRLAPRAVVSYTRHLPIPYPADVEERYQQLQRVRRDLRWNPQRQIDRLHLTDPEQAAQMRRWVQQRQRWVEQLAQASTHRARRELHRQLSALTRQMAAAFPSAWQECTQQLAAVAVERRRQAIATEREYPFFLYDAATLYTEIIQAATGTGSFACAPANVAGDAAPDAEGKGREGQNPARIRPSFGDVEGEEEAYDGKCRQGGRCRWAHLSPAGAASGDRDLRGFRLLPSDG